MKNNTAQPLYKKLSSALIMGLVFLTPILILPFTSNLVTHSKLFLFFLTALLLAFVFTIATFTKKSWEIVVSPLTLPLVLFGLVAIASTFFTNQYPVQAVLGMGGVFISAVLIAVLGGTLMISKKAKCFPRVLGVSAAIVSITSFLQLAGWGPSRIINRFFGFGLPNSMVFNVTGSAFVAAQVMALALVGLIAKLIISKKLTTINAVLIPLVTLGLAINVWAILPGQPSSVIIPPVNSAWTITLDSLRTPRAAIIGHGPESYSSIYSKFKPNWINGEEYWQFNFGSAANTPFTLIVTMGFLGVLAWLFIVFKILKEIKHDKNRKQPVFWIIIATFVLQLLFPVNIVLIIIQAAALAAWISIESSHLPVIRLKAMHFSILNKNQNFAPPKTNKGYWFLYAGTTVLMLVLFFSTYMLGRAYASYNYSLKADKAAQANDAVAVFENHRKAVVMNPYLDQNRRQYALTSLQIAIALSNNADITQEQRSQVVELVSQSISEARAATVLNQQSEQNWLVLAEVYKNLIGTADEADQWAVDSLVTAVELNPTNPITRIEIGKLFIAREQYQDSANFFNQAIGLKPDHPSGYYHLARAFVALEAYPQAQEALVQSLSLLDAASEDYKQVEADLEQIKPMAEEALRQQAEAQQAAQDQQSGQQPDGQQIQQQPLGELQPDGSFQPGITPDGEQPLTGETSDPESFGDINQEETPSLLDLTSQQVEQSEADLINGGSEDIEL